jgi:RND superfamily putative drug exporter
VATVAQGVGPISRDGEAALVALAIDADDRGAVVGGVEKIRRYLRAHRVAGLHSFVTGPGGIAADLERVAEDAGRTLLVATLGLVLVLLLLVYRRRSSPCCRCSSSAPPTWSPATSSTC